MENKIGAEDQAPTSPRYFSLWEYDAQKRVELCRLLSPQLRQLMEEVKPRRGVDCA